MTKVHLATRSTMPTTLSHHDVFAAMRPGIKTPTRPSRNTDDDEGDVEPTKLRPVSGAYSAYEATRVQNIYNFYLNKPIDEPCLYVDMIHKIRTAQPQDIVYIHLNTPGGRLDTGIQLINAIADSQARIIAVLESQAYSLGSLIFLAADEFIIHDNCLFMIHNFSSATFGKGNEQQSELIATLAWFRKLCTKYYSPFLSKDELERMLRGEDFWMDSDDVKKRLKNMIRIKEGGPVDVPKPVRIRNKKPRVGAELPVPTVTN